MNKIELPAWNDKLKNQSHIVVRNMQLNVPLSSIAALNEMRNAASLLRDQPQLFRHRVKQFVNRAIERGERVRTFLMLYANHQDTMDQYTDCIVDVTDSDVTALRNLITDGMKKADVPNPELVGWVEGARMLLHLAVEHFNTIMQDAKKESGYNYARLFNDARMDPVLELWYQVAGYIDPNPYVVTDEPVLQQLRNIAKGYADGRYMVQCIRMMKDNPLFAGIKINDGEESPLTEGSKNVNVNRR